MAKQKSIIVFSLVIATVAISLKFLEYNLWVRSISTELYSGILAVLFMAVGLWLGKKWTDRQAAKKTTLKATDTKDTVGLSNREMDVLALIVQGYSNQEIADHLFVSLSTIKTHVSNIFSKLDVKRRTQAVQRAKELGLFTTLVE